MITRCLGTSAVSLCLVIVACGGDDGAGMDDGATTEPSATSAAESSTGAGDDDGGPADGGDDGVGDESTGGPAGSEGSEGSSGGDATDAGDESGSGSETGDAVVYDEEFVWVADFLRTNCVACHATNMNGNLLLPTPDITNEEVRAALEGVVATTGLLLVEPGDHTQSQTWLQITNEFGAQFPVEDTDRFGAWIDAGANYYAP